jgi:peptidyl-tRNA hydrolase
LARPLTYEARYGNRAFLRVQQQFNLAPSDIIILYPDISMQPGEIAYRVGGKPYVDR